MHTEGRTGGTEAVPDGCAVAERRLAAASATMASRRVAAMPSRPCHSSWPFTAYGCSSPAAAPEPPAAKPCASNTRTVMRRPGVAVACTATVTACRQALYCLGCPHPFQHTLPAAVQVRCHSRDALTAGTHRLHGTRQQPPQGYFYHARSCYPCRYARLLPFATNRCFFPHYNGATHQ